MGIWGDEGGCWLANILLGPSEAGRAPGLLSPAQVTLTGRAELLPEYGDPGVRVAGVGGASPRPYKIPPREAGWGWWTWTCRPGGWRRVSPPIPAVLLAPAAPVTKNSTFTPGQPYESRPAPHPSKGWACAFSRAAPGPRASAWRSHFNPEQPGKWGLRVRGGGLIRGVGRRSRRCEQLGRA